jgi:hypothetical protein
VTPAPSPSHRGAGGDSWQRSASLSNALGDDAHRSPLHGEHPLQGSGEQQRDCVCVRLRVCLCACECVHMRVCASACVLFSLALGAFPSQWEWWLTASSVSLHACGGDVHRSPLHWELLMHRERWAAVCVRMCVCACVWMCACVPVRVSVCVCTSVRLHVYFVPCSGSVAYAMGVVVGSVQGLSPTLWGDDAHRSPLHREHSLHRERWTAA